MKRCMILCALSIVSAVNGFQDYAIDLQPIWQNLDSNQATTKQFGGKWILAGSITFKKRSGESVALHSLRLQWKGPRISSLFGTLYKKRDGLEFLPLEENMICDGVWLPAEQALLLPFDKKIALGLSNTFYLVLTLSEECESLLKKGMFALDERILPEPYTHLLRGQQIALAYHQTQVS